MISTIQQTIRRTVRSRESPAALDFFMGKCYIPDMKKQMEKKARPPEGAAADWTIPQNWPHYTAQDHATWDRLFARQSAFCPAAQARRICAGWTCFALPSRVFLTLTNCRNGRCVPLDGE